MLRVLLILLFYSPLIFGQNISEHLSDIKIDNNAESKLSISQIDSLLKLRQDSIYNRNVLRDIDERWHRLSNNQLIRILWVSSTYNLSRDSLVNVIYSLRQGYSRDSNILWLEEGGLVGDELKRIKMIEANKYQIITEAYNYFGDIRKIDLSLRWYAIVLREDERVWKLENVNPKVVLSQFQSEESEMEFDIQHNRDLGSHFLFGCPVSLDTGFIDDFKNKITSLNPGKTLNLSRDNIGVKFSLNAMGSVTGPGSCGGLKDYSLLVTYYSGLNNEFKITQDIGDQIVDSLNNCVPELFWSGDLMGDDIPDALFLQNISGGLRLVLFLSDPSPLDQIWIKSAEWILLNQPRED